METEMRLGKMVCTILLVWFVAWTPYAVMSFWAMLFDSDGLSPLAGLIPTLCTKGSAFANALMYGIRYDDTVLNMHALCSSVYTVFILHYRINILLI